MVHRIHTAATIKPVVDAPTADDVGGPPSAKEAIPAVRHDDSTTGFKARLMARMGMTAAPMREPAAQATRQPLSALLDVGNRLRSIVGPPAAADHASGDSAGLTASIRRNLPMLPTSDARRHERTLETILRITDATVQLPMLRQFVEQIAETGRQQRSIAPEPAFLRAISRTTVNGHFQDMIAERSQKKAQQLLDLRLTILDLPPMLAQKYHASLQQVLMHPDAGRRDALLLRMARQVATRTGDK